MLDPIGLYLRAPLTAGMVAPDGTDAASFWRVERGAASHVLRARFEVPPTKKYVLGDVKLEGRPIEFGGQLAERVQVWISVAVKRAASSPPAKPCGA
jgi:hypothetical protein